jgi:hypothetical protein
MTGLITYESLLEEVWKKIGPWKKDKQFFCVRSFLEFGVRSGMSPQGVEPIFTEWILELASTASPNKHNLRPRETTKTALANSLGTFLLTHPHLQAWGPQVRIAASAETMDLALRNTAKIKSALESNAYVLKVVGSQRPDKDWLKDRGLERREWNVRRLRTRICIEAEMKNGNAMEEPSLMATSSLKAATGVHYEVLLDDDPMTSKSASSDALKKRARENFQERQNQITRHHVQVINGTRHAEDDLHYTIQTDFGANFNFDVRSVWDDGPELYKDDFEKDENGMWVPKMPLDEVRILWLGYGQLETDAKLGGIPKDPNERKKRALHFLRMKMDDMTASTWTRNMLNRTMSDEERTFRPEMFHEYRKDEFRSHNMLFYILTDAASGRDFRSSLRVVATIAMDGNDTAHCVDLQYGLWGPNDYSKRIMYAAQRYGARAVLMEEMSFRAVFEENLKLVSQIEKIHLPRVVTIKGISAMSKRARIEALEPRLLNRKLLFNPDFHAEKDSSGKSKWDEIVRQFGTVHDLDTQPRLKVDIADALSLIEGYDEYGTKVCRGPRYRNPIAGAADANKEQKVRLGILTAPAPSRASVFGGKRGFQR